MTLNQHQIETAQLLAAQDFHRPNLGNAVLTVARLSEWTDENMETPWENENPSTPAYASRKLQDLIESHYGEIDEDLSNAEYKAALRPVTRFLARNGIERITIIPSCHVSDSLLR